MHRFTQNVQQFLLVVSHIAKLQLRDRPLVGMVFPISLSSNTTTWRPTRRGCCSRSVTWSCCRRYRGTSGSTWSCARRCCRTARSCWRCRRGSCRRRRRSWSTSSHGPVKPEYLIWPACDGNAGCFQGPRRAHTKAAAGVLPGCALIRLHSAIPPEPGAVREKCHVSLHLDPVCSLREDCHAGQGNRKGAPCY